MGSLKVKDISLNINNSSILKGINLEINKGEFVFITGPSGSGKSSLLKLMGDLISPTNGTILYKDKEYFSYKPEELRKMISYCNQTPYLFGQTVKENLEFPYKIRKQEVDYGRIKELFKLINLKDDYLNKGVNDLSGGERQRIALIRNVIFNPEILLLDEVTSALDEENKRLIEILIREVNKLGITVVWVTHDIEQTKRFNSRLIKINSGKLEGDMQ
ncbi:ATP-binding cassette domain-containing protein [Clostridium carnis]